MDRFASKGDKPDPEDEIDFFVIPITVGLLVAM
jgi:hypothetical protein